MSAANNGGPAFPTGEEHGFNNGEPGMTLRDYAAFHSDVPWEVAADKVYRQKLGMNGTTSEIAACRARLRYEQADAMLAERAK